MSCSKNFDYSGALSFRFKDAINKIMNDYCIRACNLVSVSMWGAKCPVSLECGVRSVL